MQWTADKGAGFSTADPATFPRPLVEGPFSAEHVNARDQSRDKDSLLTFVQHLVTAYRACPELAWGPCQVLDPGPKAGAVLANRTDADGTSIVTVHNVGARRVTATLPLADLAGRDLYDVLAATGEAVPVGEDGTLKVTLQPYGFRWLRSAP
jgi:sucrose hydrolase-like protein